MGSSPGGQDTCLLVGLDKYLVDPVGEKKWISCQVAPPSSVRPSPCQPERHRAALRLRRNRRAARAASTWLPETWWVFHKLIPLLSAHHRVFAVDLRGFGDSATAKMEYDSATSAVDLSELIARLNLGPVHLTGQDISGPATFRVAATHPELVRSYTAIETGLSGFGLEMLADVTHGGGWHIGVLVAPDIPQMLLAGRERRSSPSTRSRPLRRPLVPSPATTSTNSSDPTPGQAHSGTAHRSVPVDAQGRG